MADVPLREYVDALFRERDKAVAAATESLNRRLDLLNEFRQQSEDRSNNFASRETAERLKDELSDLKGIALPREFYDRQHELLARTFEIQVKDLGTRTSLLERWQANVTGRVIGAGFLVVVVTAFVTAEVSRLLS